MELMDTKYLGRLFKKFSQSQGQNKSIIFAISFCRTDYLIFTLSSDNVSLKNLGPLARVSDLLSNFPQSPALISVHQKYGPLKLVLRFWRINRYVVKSKYELKHSLYLLI